MKSSNFKSELLAPAGCMQALVAAVQGGCDAVYLGHKSFSARSSAQNFDNEQLFEAVKYCHLRGVKVYLAVNTLCLKRQFSELAALIKLAARVGVDAMIVQDMGVCRIIKKVCPEMKIHASTQMTVHSLEGVKMLQSAGIERVVLSRELSREEIEYICKNTDCEIEVFVHGAICISYSGKCLFSSLVGGRSGNRGKCAQPCRLPYKFEGRRGNLISPRDMCLLKEVKALCGMGVCSLKIEGRMKSHEYVALVCSIYRKALDGGEITNSDMEKLKNIFSRGGEFTDTYFTGKNPDKLIYAGSNDNAGNTATHALLKEAAAIYGGREKRFLPIKIKVLQKESDVFYIAEYGEISAFAKCPCEDMSPLDSERVEAAATKTGTTSFKAESCEVYGDIALRISQLNELRRNALNELGEKIIMSKSLKAGEYSENISRGEKSGKPKLLARVLRLSQARELSGADGVIVPLYLVPEIKDTKNIIAEIPTIITLSDKPKVMALVKRAKEMGIKKFFCQSLDAIAMVKDSKSYIIAGFSVNASNFEAVEEIKLLGADEVILSCEIPLSEAENIAGGTNVPVGAAVYGRMPLMVMHHCVMKSKKCGLCEGEISDRMGAVFPIRCDGDACRNVIYNSRPLYLADKGYKNCGFESVILYFTTESEKECKRILDAAKNEKSPEGEFTRGITSGGKW